MLDLVSIFSEKELGIYVKIVYIPFSFSGLLLDICYQCLYLRWEALSLPGKLQVLRNIG